ncbi:MAG: PRD domain-containing protein, partial [Clostridium sp.]
NKQHDNSDTTLLELVSNSYPEAFECALKIKYYIENNYNYQVNGDEIVYLTMHIHRVISVLKENN